MDGPLDINSLEEVREVFVGTWIGMALIVELMIADEMVDRKDVLRLLNEFRAAAPGHRRVALDGLRSFVEIGFPLNIEEADDNS